MPAQPALQQLVAGQRFGFCIKGGLFFRQRRFQHGQRGLFGQLIHDDLRHSGRVRGQHLPRACASPSKQPQRLACGLCVPGRDPSQHMACVRWGNAGQLDQATLYQTFQRACLYAGAQDVGHRVQPVTNTVQQHLFTRRDPIARLTCHGTHKAPVIFAGGGAAQLRIKRGMDHLGCLCRDERNGQDPLGSQRHPPMQAFCQEMHLAVAPQTSGAHGNGLYHRAVAADAGPCGVDRGPAIAQQGYIGGGAANVADQRTGSTGHPPRPHDRGRRPAEDRFNRPFPCLRGRDQRPVPPHHHQRGRDANVGQHILGPPDQPVDHPDQPRVQHRCQRPFRPVELGRQLMRGRHGPPRHLRHQGGDALFMDGVARGELAGDGKTADLFTLLGQKGDQRGFVQRGTLCACVVMPPAKDQIGVTVQRPCQPVRLKIPLLEADIDQRDAPALPFDQRIGCQRGRQRRHRHLTR